MTYRKQSFPLQPEKAGPVRLQSPFFPFYCLSFSLSFFSSFVVMPGLLLAKIRSDFPMILTRITTNLSLSITVQTLWFSRQ